MSIILVYHVKEEHRLKVEHGEIPVDFEKNHELVAAVNTPEQGMAAIEDAYRLTQNIDDSWMKNPQVDIKGRTPASGGRRSTHLGDVLLGNGGAYVCVAIGWQKLESPTQKVEER